MVKKARLGLYLKDEKMKRQIKVVAAKRGVSTTAYCTEAIEDRLRREGELEDTEQDLERKRGLIRRMDELRNRIGPIGTSVTALIKEARRR